MQTIDEIRELAKVAVHAGSAAAELERIPATAPSRLKGHLADAIDSLRRLSVAVDEEKDYVVERDVAAEGRDYVAHPPLDYDELREMIEKAQLLRHEAAMASDEEPDSANAKAAWERCQDHETTLYQRIQSEVEAKQTPAEVARQNADPSVLLHDTADAQTWAREWLKMVERDPTIPLDEGTMLAWFANAISAGEMLAQRRTREHVEHLERTTRNLQADYESQKLGPLPE